VLLTDTLCL